jgi:hypothetical protein
MTDAAWYTKPEWVIMGGIRNDGKVMLVASTSLTRAVLRIEDLYNRSEVFDFTKPFLPVSRQCELTVTMPTFVMIVADTYEEALRNLFTQWSPTGAPQPALTGGPIAIELS